MRDKELKVISSAEAWALARKEFLELPSIWSPETRTRLNKLSEAEDNLIKAVAELWGL